MFCDATASSTNQMLGILQVVQGLGSGVDAPDSVWIELSLPPHSSPTYSRVQRYLAPARTLRYACLSLGTYDGPTGGGDFF